MAETTKIQWTHHTFNPWRGCSKVSVGCQLCYAATMSKRNPGTLGVWGDGGTRVVAAEAQWKLPLKWDRDAAKAGERRRVFCASLADVFESRELAEWIEICDGYRINYRGLIESQWRAGGHRGNWTPMQKKIDDGGYETIQLRKHPTLGDKTLKVHHLVLEAFVGERPEGHVVRHLDGRRANNVLWNLLYSTQSDNLGDRAAHGTDLAGERNGRSKLTEEDVDQIRELLQQGKSQSFIAAKFGVKQVAISRIKLGKSWSGKAVPLAAEPIRSCISGQMIDASLRPAFRTDGGFTHCPDGDSELWLPLTMADVRARLFRMIDATPNLDWLLLTKRPENIARMMPAMVVPSGDNYRVSGSVGVLRVDVIRKNLWLGVSCENQQAADERIPHLLKVPAAVRFLSVEPMLGPIRIDARLLTPIQGTSQHGQRFIDWVIVGGESGPGARPCNVKWIRDIVRQCKAAGVPVFVKQLGSHPIGSHYEVMSMAGSDQGDKSSIVRWKLRDPKGGDISEFPDDLQVREFPREAKGE